MIKTAKLYRDKHGFSIIPLKPDKRPLIKWEEFQKRHATDEEIERWWTEHPTALIGIITGKISGIAVIDIDTKDTPQELLGWWQDDRLLPAVVETPRGTHYYFKYKEGIKNAANLGGQKVDIRGEGGYVVAPPSVNDKGKRYKWAVSLPDELPEFPLEIFSQPETEFAKAEYQIERLLKFEEGARDETLFNIACNLVRGGMPEKDIRKVISELASNCNPPFSEKEAQAKVDSALKRGTKKDRQWKDEVPEWVSNTVGYFPLSACYGDLGAVSVSEKSGIRNALKRLRDKGILEQHPTKNGWYRRTELECDPLDWQDAPIEDIDLKLPFELHKKAKIYPGNIIVIAGYKDAGKTAFLLNFIKMNMDKHEIHYFSSEMGSSELKLRLGLFQDVKNWNFKAWERNANFDEVIHPNAINVIDYIEITDNHWMVGRYLQKIDAKLKDGIAIIALQKPYGRDIARGGESSLDKPRMYLAMNPGEIKIISIKNRRCTYNPNGEVLEFKLVSGSDFSDNGIWRKLEPKEEKK